MNYNTINYLLNYINIISKEYICKIVIIVIIVILQIQLSFYSKMEVNK